MQDPNRHSAPFRNGEARIGDKGSGRPSAVARGSAPPRRARGVFFCLGRHVQTQRSGSPASCWTSAQYSNCNRWPKMMCQGGESFGGPRAGTRGRTSRAAAPGCRRFLGLRGAGGAPRFQMPGFFGCPREPCAERWRRRARPGLPHGCAPERERKPITYQTANLTKPPAPASVWQKYVQDMSVNGTWVDGHRLVSRRVRRLGVGARVSFLPSAHTFYRDSLLYEVHALLATEATPTAGPPRSALAAAEAAAARPPPKASGFGSAWGSDVVC